MASSGMQRLPVLLAVCAGLCLCLCLCASPVAAWPVSNLFVATCNASDPYQVWNVTQYPTKTDGWSLSLARVSTPGFDPNYDCIDCGSCKDQATPHTGACSPRTANPPSGHRWDTTMTTSTAPTRIRSLDNGNMCLEATEAVGGGQVLVTLCNVSLPNQGWTYDKTTLLVHTTPGLCLAAQPPTANCSEPPFSTFPYCNSALTAEERARDLAQRLTVEELALTLQNSNEGVPRLAVPPIRFNEALHGVCTHCGPTHVLNSTGQNNTGCATSFPHALLMASSFNATLWRTVGSAISTEGRAFGNMGQTGVIFWSPTSTSSVILAGAAARRLPARTHSSPASMPCTISAGMQEGDDPRYLKIISTAKHFADYDLEVTSNGTLRRAFNAIVNDQDQVEFYWPAWRAAIEGAHVQSVMCSYNSVNGIPSCGHELFNNGVMREQWQFDGFMVSDCGAIRDPAFVEFIQEHYNGDPDYQVRQGIVGGCDLNCGQYYAEHLEAAVQHGVLLESDAREAAYRVFKRAFMVGVFDEDISYASYGPNDIDTDEHRALSLSAAEQGMILLQNNNSLLPLDKSKTFALLGPHFNATQEMISIYHGPNVLADTHSPYQVMKARGYKIAGYAPGCVGTTGDDPDGSTTCTDTSGFAAATAIAAKADVAIVFVGLTPGFMTNKTSDAREAEGCDRNITALPGHQEDLIKAVMAANKNTVVVLIHGAPLSIEWTKANIDAILDAHYPGQLGGDAIVNTLFGDVSPAGRLTTLIYPADVINARQREDMNLRDKGGLTYKYYQGTPLWDFGFGLSYTTFKFTPITSHVRATTEEMGAWSSKYYASGGLEHSPAAYTVNVTNTGSVASDCAVLGFVQGTAPGDPRKELFGFDRVHLAPGETTTVYFSVPPSVLSTVDHTGTEFLRPGLYNIIFGVNGSSEGQETVLAGGLELVGEPLTLFSLAEVRSNFQSRMTPAP